MPQKPITEKLVFKAPKQPVVIQQPTFTTIYDQSPVQGVTGELLEEQVYADTFPTGPQTDYAVDYRQESLNVGGQRQDKLSNILYVPGTSTKDRSTYGHFVSSYNVPSADVTEDKSSIFVAVPVEDTSSAIFHSSGIAPSGGFVQEKQTAYDLSSENVGSTVSSQISPFKSYYSSSYPGYSHVSGDSPRFGFSHDRSLLYTYKSPEFVSPFSYVNEQPSQVFKKSVA